MLECSDFIQVSRYAGMREDLVQAGGGNSAYKVSPDRMLIKASGYQLAEMNEKEGFAIVNPQLIRESFLKCDDLDRMTDAVSREILKEALIDGMRPSIETFLHSVSGRCSLHTHPIVVNALTCRERGEAEITCLFPDALIVPYATPGVELAKAYFKRYREYRQLHGQEPKIVFLMNHGLLVSADTADEVIFLTENILRKVEAALSVDLSAYHAVSMLNGLFKDGVIWLVTDSHVTTVYEVRGSMWNHCFCPDCVVFLGKKVYNVGDEGIDEADYLAFVEKNGFPTLLSWRKHLYIHAASVKKALEIQSILSFSVQVAEINEGIAVNYLAEREKDFLLGWDAEKYRQKMK